MTKTLGATNIIDKIVEALKKGEDAPDDISALASEIYGTLRQGVSLQEIAQSVKNEWVKESLSPIQSNWESIIDKVLEEAHRAGARREIIEELERLKNSLWGGENVAALVGSLRPYRIGLTKKSGDGSPIMCYWEVSGWVDLHFDVRNIGSSVVEGKKGRKQKEAKEKGEGLQHFTVPLGQIGIAMQPGGVVSHSQIPEIYIGGEGIWGGYEHFDVLLLRSIPIESRSKVSVEVPAISVTESDRAVVRASLRMWLQDPLKFARQAIVGSTIAENIENLSQVQKRLGDAVLDGWEDFLLSDTDGGELWISDKETLEQKGYHIFEKRLSIWGLAVVEFVCSRVYPQNLYDTALEIGEVEYALVHNKKLQEKFGDLFDKEEEQRWRIMQGKGALPGEWFLSLATREGKNLVTGDFVERISALCSKAGAPLCERFVTEWYKLSTPTERAFAKQMVLAALKRPRLVIGSWLDRTLVG